MKTSITKETTPFSSKQSFVRVDRKAVNESIGPHSGLYGKMAARERGERLKKYQMAQMARDKAGKSDDDDIYSVISGMSSAGTVEIFGSVHRSRPLSPVRLNRQNHDDDAATFYSSSPSGREMRARASPYLKHLGSREREEMLMELGSVSLSSDNELNAEMQLKAMLKTLVEDTGKPKKDPFKFTRTNSDRNASSSSSSSKLTTKLKAKNSNSKREGNGGGVGRLRAAKGQGNGDASPAHFGTNSSHKPDMDASLGMSPMSTMSFGNTKSTEGVDEDGERWWEDNFAGDISDEYTRGFVVDLSPSVSTASSEQSWAHTDEIGAEYSFTRSGDVPEDY